MLLFKFNDIQNTIYNLQVLSSNHLIIPKRRLQFISVPGRTGDLIIDDKSTENFNIEIKVLLKAQSYEFVEIKNEIEKWLYSNGYKNLEFSDGFKFKAISVEEIKFIKISNNKYEAILIFNCFKDEVQI